MEEKTNGNKALGRGIAGLVDIPKTEVMKASEAVPAIVGILQAIHPKFHPVIFESVLAFMKADRSEMDEIAEIGEALRDHRNGGWFRK